MEKLSSRQAVTLIITTCTNISILIVNQVAIESFSSASILNSVYVGIISIILTILICTLYRKFVGVGILDISEYLGGKFLKVIVGILFIFYFLATASTLLCKLVEVLKIIYYPITNNVYINLLFIIATGIICNLKNNASIRVNSVILPISLITLILAFVGNFKNFDMQNIYPIFGNGIDSTFIKGISSLYSFGGIAYIFFLPPVLKNSDKLLKISIWGMVVSSIFMIVTISTITLMFNDKMVNGQLFPIYTVVRYIEFGTFFQRLDSAFLLIRIMAFLSYMGITANLILKILKNILSIKDEKPLVYPLMLLIFSISIIFNSYYELDIVQNEFIKILFVSICIGGGFTILICANLKKAIQDRRSKL